mmetsp:Transcript_93624/g.265089  ORF Transcript_93624/g.265089 Transcript_93624/m.265089 type:complete len:157 (-) Transcript_93624:8-478(-)
MGRGGGGRGGGDKHAAYLAAIHSQKVETIRWSLLYGGLTATSCDENGHTAIMVAAAAGKEKSLDAILDVVRRARSAALRSENLDARDGDGQTALMMAAAGGRLECVRLLMDAGARLDLQDQDGYTARARADWAGKQAVVDLLDGKEEEEEDDAEEK